MAEKKVKAVPDTAAQMLKDAVQCAGVFLNLTTCVGGRYINAGYVCPHDGCESAEPKDHCYRPLRGYLKETPNA